MKLSDFKALTFDVYGTLIDWESGMVNGLKPLTDRLEVPLSRNEGESQSYREGMSRSESESQHLRSYYNKNSFCITIPVSRSHQ